MLYGRTASTMVGPKYSFSFNLTATQGEAAAKSLQFHKTTVGPFYR